MRRWPRIRRAATSPSFTTRIEISIGPLDKRAMSKITDALRRFKVMDREIYSLPDDQEELAVIFDDCLAAKKFEDFLASMAW